MNDGPTNMFGDKVKVGDLVAITTTSWIYSRTRIAKVERIDGKRTFVRLLRSKRAWVNNNYSYEILDHDSYVKEVFGVGMSIPVCPSMIPSNILKALKYEN